MGLWNSKIASFEMEPGSYTYEEIASAFEEDSRWPLENCIGHEYSGYHFINHIRNRNIPEGVITEQEFHDFVLEWARALDVLYFFGNLLRHITIRVSNDNDHANNKMTKRLGFFDHQANQLALNKDWNVKPGDQWNRAYPSDLVATLFHEMMHAFFYNFLKEELLVKYPKDGGQGWTGHGRPWANAMVTVGDHLKERGSVPPKHSNFSLGLLQYEKGVLEGNSR